jgi:Spy/CpxP family protein refolding chaperone
MRKKIAIGTLGLMVLLAAAIVTWAQEGPPPGPDPGERQHQFGGGGPHEWGKGPSEEGGHREFGGRGWGGPEGHRMGIHRGFGGEGLTRLAENPHVRQYLGLTDDQVARLHKIGVDSEMASVKIRSDMELRHIELRELMRADNPDQSAIISKLDEINGLRGKMDKQRVQTLFSARGVLTPDQIAKVKAFMEHGGFGGEHREGMEHRGGMGHPPGHGGPGGGTPHPQTPPTQ